MHRRAHLPGLLAALLAPKLPQPTMDPAVAALGTRSNRSGGTALGRAAAAAPPPWGDVATVASADGRWWAAASCTLAARCRLSGLSTTAVCWPWSG